MRAARFHGPRDVRVEDVESPEPGPGEVGIDVAACGICGSDLHEYTHGPGTIPESPHPVTGATLPLTMGHEIGGTVAAVGDGVELDPGTTVAVNPIVWCGDCRRCAAGEYHLCDLGGFVGLSRDGGFAERVVVSREQAVAMPEGVRPALAALVEPFAVGLHAVRRSGLAAGETVAVLGGGPIGQAVLQTAVAAGAGAVVLSEPNPARRALATDADVVVDPAATDPVERIAAAVPGGVDVAFEVAGLEETVAQAMRSTRAGGTTCVVSLFEEPVEFFPTDVVTRELRLVGTAAFQGGPLADREFDPTARGFARGTLDPERLVTARIDLDDVVESGFERLLAPGTEETKVLVRP